MKIPFYLMYVLGVASCYSAMKADTFDSWWMVACIGAALLASLIAKVTK